MLRKPQSRSLLLSRQPTGANKNTDINIRPRPLEVFQGCSEQCLNGRITRPGAHPTVCGGYADIWERPLGKKNVAIKCIRPFSGTGGRLGEGRILLVNMIIHILNLDLRVIMTLATVARICSLNMGLPFHCTQIPRLHVWFLPNTLLVSILGIAMDVKWNLLHVPCESSRNWPRREQTRHSNHSLGWQRKARESSPCYCFNTLPDL